ncbi:ABC transporter permease [Pigmentiphaga soli]|uniref:ABC transporter permease n=1 Tax=Pigmentiphaga soli TaxID=1007095 RepID=A0ABP8HCA3_9BURK
MPSLFTGLLRRDRIEGPLMFLATAALFIAAWETSSRMGWLPPYLVPSPSKIAEKFAATFGTMAGHAWLTAAEIAAGFLLATAGAVVLAALIVFFKPVERAVYPWLVILQVIPKVALGPLLIIWLGFSFFPKVLMAFLLAFFPIMIDTIIGLRSIETNSIYLLRSMGAGRLGIFRYLQLPNALPHLFGSLKVAITLAVVGALVGEFIGANEGLGYVLVSANGSLDTELLFVSLVWISAQAMVFYGLVVAAEKVCVSWHVSHRGTLGRPGH